MFTISNMLSIANSVILNYINRTQNLITSYNKSKNVHFQQMGAKYNTEIGK